MKYRYDLHIHSALSPCAEKDMTPATIVGAAKLNGLDFVAVADHNSIHNVPVALAAGEAYGIEVVPAFELQTNEDIHLLCLFPTYEELKGFFDRIEFSRRENRPEIFGEQQIVDEDDNVIGYETAMLLDSAAISENDVPELISNFGGIAVPAHIDRDANSILNILGAVPDYYPTVELSTRSAAAEREFWGRRRMVIIDSDSHVLDTMSTAGEIDLAERSVVALIEALRRGK